MEQQSIAHKQLEHVIEHMKISGLFSLITVMVISAAIANDSNINEIASWLGVASILTFFRATLFWNIEKRLANRFFFTVKRDLLISSILAALIWGIGGYFMVPLCTPLELAILATATTTVICTAIPVMSPFLPAYLLFAACTITPITYRLAFTENADLAILSLVFLGFIGFSAKSFQRVITKSITLDVKNSLLLKNVTQEKEKANQANHSKSLFLASASHDLRQPLHSMGIFLETLEKDVTDTQYHTTVNHILNSHQALSDLFDSLLEISRLDSGNINYDIIDCPLSDIMTPIIFEFNPSIKEKGLTLDFQIKPETIKTDPILFGRIIRNLLSNAIKFTENGGITVSSYCHNDEVILNISDTGVGIEKDKQKHIFKEYFQINNTARERHNGVGLGLSVVKKISHLLHHEITVSSTPNVGSQFSLAIKKGNSENVAPPITQSISLSADKRLKGINVLLADNEPDILNAMQPMLESWGVNCLAVLSIDEALNQLKERAFRPDVIISDYRLDDHVSGIDLIQQVHAQLGCEIPAMLISGDTDPQLRANIKQQGYFLLTKPAKSGQLKRTIITLIDDSQKKETQTNAINH